MSGRLCVGRGCFVTAGMEVREGKEFGAEKIMRKLGT